MSTVIHLRTTLAWVRSSAMNRLRRILVLAILLGSLLTLPTSGFAEDAVSPLLRLVPPDAPVVLSVENLREHYPAFASSPLAKGLERLPAVQSWMASPRYRKFLTALGKIEAFLGVPIAQIRDAIFGDAVVLVLQPPVEGRNEAQALLLIRARQPELLRRLVRLIDDAQVTGGELARCVEKRQGKTAYTLREYPPGNPQPSEYHADFSDGSFALTNSETMMRDLIDRWERIDAGTGGVPRLADLPKFQVVQRQLPAVGHAVARLFVDPRLVERLSAAAPRPANPDDERGLAILRRYSAALTYIGAALTWRDGILALQTAEAIDSAKLDPAIVRWAADARPARPEPVHAPPTAFAMASARIDLNAVAALYRQLIPAEEIARLENLEIALEGVLLGQDLNRRVLPAIGPSWIAYLDAPEPSAPLPRDTASVPYVVATELNDQNVPSVAKTDGTPEIPAAPIAAAVDNAFRTTMALTALNPRRNKGRDRLTSQEIAGRRVTSYDESAPFSYSVDRSRSLLLFGNSTRAVIRQIEASSAPGSGNRFREIRATAFPNEPTFLCLDLRAISRLAEHHRAALAEILAERRQLPKAEVEPDLNQVIALIELFDSAFVTSHIAPDASSSGRRLGLIVRPDLKAAPASKP